MSRYILRRLLLAVPIVFGVMLVTFLLFFLVQSPETMAKRALGEKAGAQAVQNWLHQRGYDRPMFLNTQPGKSPLDSQFFGHLKSLALFDFGRSDLNGEPVVEKFKRGILPSLCITFPAFLVGLWTAVCAALFLVFVRESLLDTLGTILCVVSMSLPPMVYIISGHWLGAVVLKYFPAYGFSSQGWDMGRFLVLPVFVMAICGLGGDIRLYRSIFLEHSRQDYVRTAHAKGVSLAGVYLKHILKNGAIAMLTLVVSSLPFLMMGSLLIEDFFGIPGLGGLSIDSIRTADFAQVRAVVYFGSLLYLAGITLTDICYAWVDPRIRLK
jgi:peptide/nickel transport system permease protein